MSEINRLVKNTAIIAMGNISTKLLAFFLLPIYTSCLTPLQYGMYDYFHNLVVFVVPFITILMEESVFRFLIDARDEKEINYIISNGFIIILLNIILFSLGFVLLSINFASIFNSALYLYIISSPFTYYVNAIFRGTNCFKYYTLHNFIISILVTLCSVVLAFLGICNVENLLYASAFGHFAGLLFIVIYTKIWKLLQFSSANYLFIKKMFLFSYPLIPNRIALIALTFFDSSLIIYFLGASFNGVYAISCKVGLIIITIYEFFSVSWQESASRVIGEKEARLFYSEIFKKMSKIMWSIIICAMAFTPSFFYLFINAKYNAAMDIVPFLLVGVYFNCLGLFFGGILIAYKDSKSVGVTVVKYSIIQVIISAIGVGYLGLNALVISNIIANLAFVCLRIKSVFKYVNIELLRKKDIVIGFLMWLIIFILYFKHNVYLDVISCILSVAYLMFNFFQIGGSFNILYSWVSKKFISK